MQCIFLEVGNEKRCHAAIYRTSWKVDDKTLSEWCQKPEFNGCPRFRAFMQYQRNSTTLKFEGK